MKNIILASASPRRKALLEQIGLSFDVIVSKVSESTNSVHPEDVVKDLAYQKAKKVFDSHRDSIVIGADTVVYNDGKKLGKPTGYDNWKEMLRSLSGHRHYVYTGVCVLWCGENNNTHILSFAEQRLWFMNLQMRISMNISLRAKLLTKPAVTGYRAHLPDSLIQLKVIITM